MCTTIAKGHISGAPIGVDWEPARALRGGRASVLGNEEDITYKMLFKENVKETSSFYLS